MVNIKALENTSLDVLYNTFSDAFKDYEVQLNKNEFSKMIHRRGFNPELSFGAFNEDRLVAFTFNGIGNFGNVKTAYDTGTGTVKEYRGQGLAKRIFEYSVPYLQSAGVKQYLLEVLQHNEKAVWLYKNIGFEITREFHYFVQSIDSINLKTKPLKSGYTIKSVDISLIPENLDFANLLFSWQNSFESIYRDLSSFKALGVFFHDALVAYCIYEVASGDITQLAVSSKHRRMGLGTNLLRCTIEDVDKDELKIINVPTDESCIIEFLCSINISSSGKQFEMIKQL